jgi:hypothetical protein
VVGLLVMSGSALGAGPQTQAPPQAPAGQQVNPNPIDPDTLAKQGSDAIWSLRWLGHGKYQLFIQSVSGIGYIDSFDWVAGPGMSITSVTSTKGGTCASHAQMIACVGKIKPPKCTCMPGGTMTVDFTATAARATDPKGDPIHYGDEGSSLAIKTVTPVPYHIPSSLDNNDT